MKVLDDEKDRLEVRFRKEHPLDGVEGALAPFHGVGPLPRNVVHRNVEEREECRQVRLEPAVQRQDLAHDPFTHATRVVAVLDAKVRPEQVDDRQVGRCLPIGDGSALDDEPAPSAVRVRELVEES